MAQETTRNEFEDIITAIVGGGLKGYSQGRQTELELRKELWKEKLKSKIKQDNLAQSLKTLQGQDSGEMNESGNVEIGGISGEGDISFKYVSPYEKKKRLLDIKELERKEYEATPEGQAKQAKQKAAEQALIKTEQDTATNLAKASRLIPLAKRIETEWLTTDPYTSKFIDYQGKFRPTALLVKAGAAPIAGYWDILKKGVQATKAQRADLTYSDFVSGLRAQLARAMGDVGNLSEYEQNAVLGLVPKLTDIYETGKDKIQKIFALVEDIKDARRQGYEDVAKMYEARTGVKLENKNLINKQQVSNEVPAGYKKQVNRKTGQTRIVPINQ